MSLKDLVSNELPDKLIVKSGLANHQAQAPSPWLTSPYLEAATSINTRKAYRSDIRNYEMWGGLLPASPDTISQYLTAFADKLNPRTLNRRLIALSHWHTYQGFQDPTIHPAIKKIMIGIGRTHGQPKKKARAIHPEELKTIAALLAQNGSLSALRDNALLQIGFFGALRRSELVQIQVEHIKWSGKGIEIFIPSSKTDQDHQGQYAAIPKGNHELCAVEALKNWLTASGIVTGPIFRSITKSEQLGINALTPLSVNHILKNRATEASLSDTDSLSSHSLRRGLATSAASAGASLPAIMRAGRWKQTNTVMEYIEAADRFNDNAASCVLDILIS